MISLKKGFPFLKIKKLKRWQFSPLLTNLLSIFSEPGTWLPGLPLHMVAQLSPGWLGGKDWPHVLHLLLREQHGNRLYWTLQWTFWPEIAVSRGTRGNPAGLCHTFALDCSQRGWAVLHLGLTVLHLGRTGNSSGREESSPSQGAAVRNEQPPPCTPSPPPHTLGVEAWPKHLLVL